MLTQTKLLVSAPGKTILFGEHAVVYGKTAVAVTVNLRSWLLLTSIDNDILVVNLPDISHHIIISLAALQEIKVRFATSISDKPQPLTVEIRQALLELLHSAGGDTILIAIDATLACWYLYLSLSPSNKEHTGLSVTLRSEIPVASGLGSSASLSVCFAATILRHFNHIPNNDIGNSFRELINSWAFIFEKILHSNPSGIDNSVVTYGGAIQYSKGTMKPLPGFPSLKFLLTNTNVAKNTSKQVEKVKVLYEKYPTVITPILDAIHNVSILCCELFARKHDEQERYRILSELIKINQCLLSALGVSHQTINDVVCNATTKGFASKLTGAGGGGCVISLLPNDVDKSSIEDIKTTMRHSGYNTFETEIGCKGVLFHSKFDKSHEDATMSSNDLVRMFLDLPQNELSIWGNKSR